MLLVFVDAPRREWLPSLETASPPSREVVKPAAAVPAAAPLLFFPEMVLRMTRQSTRSSSCPRSLSENPTSTPVQEKETEETTTLCPSICSQERLASNATTVKRFLCSLYIYLYLFPLLEAAAMYFPRRRDPLVPYAFFFIIIIIFLSLCCPFTSTYFLFFLCHFGSLSLFFASILPTSPVDFVIFFGSLVGCTKGVIVTCESSVLCSLLTLIPFSFVWPFF